MVGWYVFTHDDLHRRSEGCDFDGFDLATVYIYGACAAIVVGVAVGVGLARVSNRGTIVDDRPRSAVPRCLSAMGFLWMVELGMGALGLYAVFLGRSGAGNASCAHVEIGSDAELWWVLRAATIAHVSIMVARICCVCAACRVDGTPRDELLHDWEGKPQAKTRASWRRLCKCMLCCCVRVGGDATDAFEEVGALMADAFEGVTRVDLTVSDIAAGLALLRMVQKDEEDARVQDEVRGQLQRAGSAAAMRNHAGGAAVPAGSEKMHAQAVPSGVGVGGDTTERNVLAEARHYSDYALGTYGWMLYMYSRPLRGGCSLCCHCIGSACAGCGGNAAVRGDCCTCNQTALEMQARLSRSDILVGDFGNREACEVAFSVVRDRRRRALVIAVRGTLSFNDIITDLLAEGTDIREDESPSVQRGSALGIPDDGSPAYVHKGMWKAAKRVLSEIRRRRVLRLLRRDVFDTVGVASASEPSMPLLPAVSSGEDEDLATSGDEAATVQLVITGHSLGAGVSTLLALLLRREVPGLKCWAFSCPGAMMSEGLAELLEPNVISVVLGKDLAPRLSLYTFRALGDDILDLVVRARVNKCRLLRRGCCCACRQRLAPEAAFAPEGATPDTTQARAIREYQRERDEVHGGAQAERLAHFDLTLPGRVMHIVKTRTRRVACGCCKEREYRAMWANRADFRSIQISPLMLSDHFPDKVGHALAEAAHSEIRDDSAFEA